MSPPLKTQKMVSSVQFVWEGGGNPTGPLNVPHGLFSGAQQRGGGGGGMGRGRGRRDNELIGQTVRICQGPYKGQGRAALSWLPPASPELTEADDASVQVTLAW